MLTQEMKEILSSSKEIGWVLEPQAKHLLSSIGIVVPRFFSTIQIEEALRFAEKIGYPVVGKVVSPKVIHKSDKNGVEVGIDSERKLKETFHRFSKIEGFAGMLIEEVVSGLELILGAKNDYQFGPVILFGMGGVWVEIYRDVILKMAPLGQRDIDSMIRCLKGRPLLEGYRGAPPANLGELKKLLKTFSDLVMEVENLIESIDLNPVICSPTKCVVADARIMLRT
jgi:acetate---CoA ligase (ADP-forming) subunit beta